VDAAYVALGSNIAPQRHLPEAVRRLARLGRVRGASRVYRTAPWGYADQPDFLNAVVALESTAEPLALLETLLALETEMGRERTIPNGPRTIDLDLLLWGARIVVTPRLTLPHPRLHRRAFALVPLCDLAPHLRHPVLGRTMAELLAPLDRSGVRDAPLELPV